MNHKKMYLLICSNISTRLRQFVIAGLLATALFACNKPEKAAYNYVNPNIGTAHSRWFFYTPAAQPFGMAKPAPSTNGHYGNKWGWEAVGYDDRHSSIESFVNVHEFQVGGIAMMPTVGHRLTQPGLLEEPDAGYRSRFTKENEVAQPGYYSVVLDDYGIKAELTSTKRVAVHRYTFPQSEQAHILFDIGRRQGESGKVVDAMVRKAGTNIIEGWVRTEPEYVKKYQSGAFIDIYFSAELDRAIDEFGMFRGDIVYSGADLISGEGAGAYVTFKSDANEQVEIQVGLSYTSIDNARLNRTIEGLSFDSAKAAAMEIWANELNKIKVSGGTESDKIKFYTGLYHAILGRGLASDVNGAYPKNNGSVGQIPLNEAGEPEYNFYNTDAIWGAFWNLTQVWALVWPEYYNDYVQSHLLVYKDTGWLGDGLANSRYVSGVGTNFVGLIIAAAYNCGIRNYDVNLALEAALKNELEWKNRHMGAGKLDVEQFVKSGYIAHTDDWGDIPEATAFCASHMLEYSFSAHAVAQMARSLGQLKEYEQLKELSSAWEYIFNEESGFIHPRDSVGNFIPDFKPFQAWRGFQEGNSWQYSFYIPHHINQLVDMMGEAEFVERLDTLFLSSRADNFGGGTEIDAFAGVETIYNHGNQPSLHISWLYNFTGQPEKTQYWTRTICDEFYGTNPIHGYGYGQDEDQGQLGAWYVMASIGLFDVAGLTNEVPTMQIGSPAFDEVRISLNPNYYSGKQIVIKSKNNTPDNKLLQSAKLNGKKLDKYEVAFEDLVNGATIELEKTTKTLYNNEK